MLRSGFETGLLLIAITFASIGCPSSLGQQPDGAPQPAADGPTGAMRTLHGKHLTLVTDLPSTPAVDSLPGAFDQAVAQWAAYFHVEAADFEDWHIRGYLMRNDQRFRDQGFLPDDLPPFLHGYQRGDSLWVREQPSEYYRRHLLLHEGTHAFMPVALGGTGATWYMEGVAEYLATHRIRDHRLSLHAFPASRDDVPHWGRIKIIRDAVASGRALSIAEVLQIDGADFRRVDAYAWAWAVVVFFESNPQFSQRFADLQRQAKLPRDRFSVQFWQALQADQRELQDAWEVFLSQLNYGYDARADSISYQPVESFEETRRVTITANRGWQSTGLELSGGRAYRVRAHGRYRVATGDEDWWCEPGGVTLKYYDGMPLGQLIAVLSEPESGHASFSRPVSVGVNAVLRPERDAVLFLRVNEQAGQLQDNEGSLLVQIEEVVGSTN